MESIQLTEESILLEAKDLTKRYGKRIVLGGVSFDVQPGEVLGLFGPNGSGKSTLLDVLALATRPTTGMLVIAGHDTGKAPGLARPLIGYVPQDIALFEELTVMDNLLCWTKEPRKKVKARIASVLSALRLLPVAKQKINTLSGGMKRRVNLAVALLCEPKLLLLDEPFVGMDAQSVADTQALLWSIAQTGTAEIISGHTPEQILPLANRVLVISGGQPVFLGERDAFLAYGKGNPFSAMQVLASGMMQ